MTYELELNRHLEEVRSSRSVTLLAKVRELQAKDPSILNFTGGEPDFATPEAICQEAFKQMMKGETHYADSRGVLELRQALAKKLKEDNNIPYTADQILITPGAKFAICTALMALLNTGDEVIWLSPGWVSYPALISFCHGIPVQVKLKYDENYVLKEEYLEEKTTEKTKVLIINYPNNPTGKTISQEEMDGLKSYLRKHPNVVVISDEIYEKIIFDGRENLSLAADPDLFHRVITINGFSKCSAMTGWRVGYLACPDPIYRGALKIFQHAISCTSTFIQKAAVVALDLKDEMENMRAAYERRRNIMYEGFKEIPCADFRLPEGSFYAWVKFDTDMKPADLCNKLLDDIGVGAIPGDAYGDADGCLLRFCFAADDDSIRELIRRLKEYFNK